MQSSTNTVTTDNTLIRSIQPGYDFGAAMVSNYTEFRIDPDKVKTPEDMMKVILHWISKMGTFGKDGIEGIEQFVVASSVDGLTPQEIVKLRNKGVTFSEELDNNG